MSAQEFHQYVRGQAAAVRSPEGRSTEEVVRALEDRVQGDLLVFDSTQLEVVRLLRYVEGEKDSAYPQTQRVIAMLMDAGYPGPEARAAMMEIKAEIHEWKENRAFAQQIRQQMHTDLTAAKYATDLLWVRNQVQLGYNHLHSGQQEAAEPYFLDALSYPYTLVEDVEVSRQMRELYIEAGKGLILVRKGDPEALQEIYFIPALKSILDPIRDQALEAARQ